MGRGTAATALVEGDDTVEVGIEEAARQGIATGAGAAVDEDDRQSVRRTAFVGIQHMRFVDGQLVASVGFNFRIQN